MGPTAGQKKTRPRGEYNRVAVRACRGGVEVAESRVGGDQRPEWALFDMETWTRHFGPAGRPHHEGRSLFTGRSDVRVW